MPSIALITTTAGRAAINSALVSTDQQVVADVVLSDTNQAVGVGTTSLSNIVATLEAEGSVREAGDGHAMHVVITDDSDAAYDVRAIALRLDDGTFLMVYSQLGLLATKVASASLHLSIDQTIDADTAAAITFGDTDWRLPAASEEAAGAVELATNAEVQAGTDAFRAVTPAGLAACTATLTRQGVVELATSAETVVGLDTLRAVTPGGLKAKFDDFLAGTGAGDPVLFTRDVDVQGLGLTAVAVSLTSNATREVPIPLAGGQHLEADWTHSTGTDAITSDGATTYWLRPINEFLPRTGTFKRLRSAIYLNGANGTAFQVTLQKRTMDPTNVANPTISDVVQLARTANNANLEDSGTVTHAFNTESEQWFIQVRSSGNVNGDVCRWVSLTIQTKNPL